MSENLPNSCIIIFDRVGAVWAAPQWVMQLILRWLGGFFVWSIRGGVRSAEGGDTLEPWPWDKVLPKNIPRPVMNRWWTLAGLWRSRDERNPEPPTLGWCLGGWWVVWAAAASWGVYWGRGSGVSMPTAASLLMHLSSSTLECNGSPWLSQKIKIRNRSGTHKWCPRATTITEF